MNSGRARLHLTKPPEPSALRGHLPDYRLDAGTALLRSHNADRGAVWFASDGAGRFDLPAPRGTCYTAESAVVALLETWAGMQLVPRYLTEQRAISTMRTSGDLQIADLTRNSAIQFGITAEIFTTGEYALTQQWAHAIAQAGYAGVRYWARHDLAHTDACIAVFSHTDTNIRTVPPLTAGPPTPVGAALLHEFTAATGVTILDTPEL